MFATHDVTNLRLRDAVVRRQLSLGRARGGVALANLQDLRFCQFAIASMAVFVAAVAGVVGGCAEKQMGRVTALGVVAVMTDEQTIRYSAKEVVRRQTMPERHLPSTNRDLPTASAVDRAGPRPARIGSARSVYPLDESVVQWPRSSSHVGMIPCFQVTT